MKNRRHFVKLSAGVVAGVGLFFNPWFNVVQNVYAKVKKKLLPADTMMKSLIMETPEHLDTRNLKPTPLNQFQTMGKARFKVDLEKWRLKVTGKVKNPIELSYAEIKELPSIEREALMICPGFFAQHGRWKGISLKSLLEKAQPEGEIKEVICLGEASRDDKVETFSIEEVDSEQVFIAYEVNGETLPEKHGFPVRIVAEGHFGDDWVKYLHTVQIGANENEK